jgi:tetratricopeptide (TPR) repeat protein
MKTGQGSITGLAMLVIIILTASVTVYPQMSQLQNKLRLARSYERNGNLDKAKVLYGELLQAQPWNQTYLRGLNDIYIRLKEYDESVSMLNDRILKSPNDINSRGMLGSTYYVMGERGKAFDIWDKALEINPENQVNYRIIANYAIENRAFEKAINILESGKAVAKDPKIFSYDLAAIYVANMNYKKATREYCFILETEPTQLKIIEKRILNYFTRQGAAEASIEAVKEYMAGNDNTIYKELLSFFYLQNKQFDEALGVVVDLDKQTGSEGGEIFKFAREAFYNSEYDIARTAYSIIIRDYPGSAFVPSAKIGLARSGEAALDARLNSNSHDWKPYSFPDTSMAGEYNSIINSYRTLIDLYRNNEIAKEAQYRIGVIEFERQGKFGEAREIFEDLEKKAPASDYGLDATVKLGELYIIKGDLSQAKKKYAKASMDRRSGTDTRHDARYMLAQIDFWEGNFSEASEKLADITSDLSDNTANDAIELSMLINTAKQDSLNLAEFAKASLLAARYKFEDASKIFKSISENKNLFILNVIAKYKYAEMLVAGDKYQESVSVLRSISEDEYSSLFSDKSLFLLANLYRFGLNDKKNALAEYENLLEKYPNSLYFDKAREMINVLNAQTDESI